MPEDRTSLRGLSVVITRPVGQSTRLAKLVEAHGGIAVLLPVLTIEPVVPGRLDLAGESIAAVVFISANAVHHGLSIVQPFIGAASAVIGAGSATEAELKNAGLTTVPVGDLATGSEALLELAELSPTAVGGRAVVIVRGQSGRELLADTLQKRGANVHYVEAYRRVPNNVSIARTLAAAAIRRPDILVFTSTESISHLARLIDEQQDSSIRPAAVAALSHRILDHARALGFAARAEVAATANDEGLMTAIHQLAKGFPRLR